MERKGRIMAAYDFNANEIFEMAVQIEVNGQKFYNNAAASISDADAKAFLTELAKMEVDHENTFKAMQKELAEAEKTSTTFDPAGDAALYLKALADTRVFYEKEIDTTSMKEILKAAITAEKDSIVFYLGMKELVPEKYGKDKLDAIIKEEMGHIRLLSQKLVSL